MQVVFIQTLYFLRCIGKTHQLEQINIPEPQHIAKLYLPGFWISFIQTLYFSFCCCISGRLLPLEQRLNIPEPSAYRKAISSDSDIFHTDLVISFLSSLYIGKTHQLEQRLNVPADIAYRKVTLFRISFIQALYSSAVVYREDHQLEQRLNILEPQHIAKLSYLPILDIFHTDLVLLLLLLYIGKTHQLEQRPNALRYRHIVKWPFVSRFIQDLYFPLYIKDSSTWTG